MVGSRVYFSALSRLSTTCRISSTKPSRPTNAVIAYSCYSHIPLFHYSTSFLLHVFHADDLQQPFQVGVTEKGNLQRAFALGVPQMHLGAQALAQLVFEVSHVHIVPRRGRHNSLRRAAVCLLLQPRNQCLGLAHIKAFFEDAFDGQLL